jgi:hypothetical protein
MIDTLEAAIKKLAEQSGKAEASDNALRFAEAALYIANTLVVLNNET